MSAFAFRVRGAAPVTGGLGPAIAFACEISTDGERIEALALRARAQIEPWRRTYGQAERELLAELSLTRPVQLAEMNAMTASFDQTTTVSLTVPTSYDMAVAGDKYFAALGGGDVPLRFFFNGTAFRGGERGFAVEMLPWDAECSFDLPLEIWRQAMDACFPGRAWIGLERTTFDALLHYRVGNGLHSWEQTMAALLAARSEREPA